MLFQDRDRQITKRIKQLNRLIETLTNRLVTCPLDDFAAVQTELFKAQNELKGLQK